MSRIKRMFWDIETAPNIGYFWKSGYKLNIPPENIISERSIICICWKYENTKRIHSLNWDGGDDSKMVASFLEELSKTDEIVAHFGDRFDMPWFKGRCAFHGFNEFPTVTTIDTVAIAKRNFNFNSNKLDYLADHLCGYRKMDTGGFSLWKDVMEGDTSALSKMVRYCKHDVFILEQVYHKLNSFVRPKTHAGVMNGYDRWSCPWCGSERVHKSKTSVTATGITRHQFKCNMCSRYYTVANSVYLNYKETH